MLILLDFLLIPSFYRWAGSDSNLPKKRLLRIVGIPVYIYFRNPTWEIAALMVLFGVLLSLDLDAIEWKNWGYVFSRGLAFGFCLYPIAGLWSVFIPAVRTYLLYWSNIGSFGTMIRHKWTEIGTGVSIALAINL